MLSSLSNDKLRRLLVLLHMHSSANNSCIPICTNRRLNFSLEMCSNTEGFLVGL